MKRNQTPWEAYGGDEERWNDIIQRVKSWKGGNAAKLRRFELKSTEELEGFAARQMNDTRYTTRLAVDLLRTLYGGLHVAEADGSTRQAIFASSGSVTATLRKVWGLEGILREALPSANGENHGKPRTDHRHHAIDAIAIALSSSSTIQRMNAYAATAIGARFRYEGLPRFAVAMARLRGFDSSAHSGHAGFPPARTQDERGIA